MRRPEWLVGAPRRGASSTLASRREAVLQRLEQGLVQEAPLQQLQDLRARLQLIDDQLATATSPRRRWTHHLVAVLIVAALVSILALVPVPRVAFSLDAEADAVQWHMPDQGALAGERIDGELRAEGFSRLESGDGTLVELAQQSGPGELGVEAPDLRLRQVRFAAGTELGVQTDGRSARLVLEGGRHSVAVDLSGAAELAVGGGPRHRRDYPVAEWIRLSSDGESTALRMARAEGHDYRWQGLQPDVVRFTERQAGADGQVRVVSALRRGVLRLPASERQVDVAPGAGLVLEGLRLDRADLVVGERVSLRLAGTARAVSLETGGFVQSLKPSWLELAAHHHTLALMWSAAGMLWGIATGLRKAAGEPP